MLINHIGKASSSIHVLIPFTTANVSTKAPPQYTAFHHILSCKDSPQQTNCNANIAPSKYVIAR